MVLVCTLTMGVAQGFPEPRVKGSKTLLPHIMDSKKSTLHHNWGTQNRL
jgi:hypothetical protein